MYALIGYNDEYYYIQIFSETDVVYGYIIYNFSGDKSLVVDNFPISSVLKRFETLYTIEEIQNLYPELKF